MNAEERLQDQKNNLFKGILIENQRIEKPPWREVVYDKVYTVNAVYIINYFFTFHPEI